MKKLSAVLLSVMMLVAFCLPMNVLAEGALPLRVSVGKDISFPKGEVTLPITVENYGKSDISISKITVETTNSFSSAEISLDPAAVAPKQTTDSTGGTVDGTVTIPIEVNYTGRGNAMKITLTTGSGTFTTTLVVSGAVSAEPGSNTPPSPEDAKLYVYSAQKSSVKSGDVTAFPITVGAQSGYSAKNVKIRISGAEEGYKSKFSFQGGTYTEDYIWDQAEITPTLIVSPSISDGNYTLNVEFSYQDELGNSYTATDTLAVTVHGTSNSSLYVKSASFDKAEVGKDNKAILTVNIVNPTEKNFNKLTVSLNTELTKNFTLYENFQPVNTGSIDAGKSAKASFSAYIDSAVGTGNYPVTFNISYSDTAGNVYTSQETIYVLLTRSADAESGDKGSKPRIIVSKYSTDVEQIEAGKSFKLTFSLQNTSASTEVTNVKVTLASDAATGAGQTGGTKDIFFPAAGSNSFFIEKIGKKSEVSNIIELMTSQDTEPGVFSVKFNIEYDADGTPVSSTEQIAFPVTQQQRLEIQNFNVGTDAMAGNPVKAYCQYINKGKSTIYNFSISVEGDFTMQDGGGYVGNLTSGYYSDLDAMITPTGEGECKGAIVFSYEDSQGEQKEERKEFTVNVQPMDIPSGGNGDMMGKIDPETGFPIDPVSGKPIDPMTGEPISTGLGVWGIVLWCGVGVVAIGAAVVAIIIIKKKKAKKAQVEDEED